MSGVPQFPQKWAFSGLSAWQFAHFIVFPSPDSSENKLSAYERKCNISFLHTGPATGYNAQKILKALGEFGFGELDIVTGDYGSDKIYFIGLNDLIENKKMSGHPSDKIDIDILEKAGNEKK